MTSHFVGWLMRIKAFFTTFFIKSIPEKKDVPTENLLPQPESPPMNAPIYPDPPVLPAVPPKNIVLDRSSKVLLVSEPDVVLERLSSLLNRADAVIEDAQRRFEKGPSDVGLIGLGGPKILDLRETISGPDSPHGSLSDWRFLGDIHGDFFSLWLAIETVIKKNNGRICFLGDLVDRGPCDLGCFLLILETAKEHPGRIAWIGGNHDVYVQRPFPVGKDPIEYLHEIVNGLKGLGKVYTQLNKFSKEQFKKNLSELDLNSFKVSFDPAEFVVWLNGDATDGLRKKTGELFVDLAEKLPRAIIFPSGVFASHAGIPLNDRYSEIKSLDSFNKDEDSLRDLCWVRYRKFPNKFEMHLQPSNSRKRKIERSSEFLFGKDNLKEFQVAMRDVFDVKAVIRGHDHESDGFLEDSWKNATDPSDTIQLLTLTGSRHSKMVTMGIPEHLILGKFSELNAPGNFPIVLEKIPLVEVDGSAGLQSFYRNTVTELPSRSVS
jgi:hypothetical protein